jgi:hypothetical protein
VARERKGLVLLKKRRRRVLAKAQNLSALHGTEAENARFETLM